MPLKLNIAMSRKVGTANYGSRGATVGLEMELDSSLVEQPDQLHKRIDDLFRLATEAVSRELDPCGAAAARHAAANGTPETLVAPVRLATANQVRAIHAIANRRNLDVTAEIRNRFGVYRADDLTLEQASQFIDAIKLLACGTAADNRESS